MKHLWQRIAGLGGGRSTPPADETVHEVRYAQEFMEAFDRTQTLGLAVPPVRLLVEKDCVNLKVITPAIQKYLGEFREEEALGQAFAINVNLIPFLYAETGIPFTLTLGWFEHMGKELFRHSEQLLRAMLRNGISSCDPKGIPMHVWLTSPACEVLDVTLPTTIAAIDGVDELSGGIIYISNREVEPLVIYHPTVVGIEFLEKVGAAFPIGGGRH